MAIIFIEWPTFVEDIIGNVNSASNISVTRDSLIGDGPLRVLLGNEYVFGCIIVALCILLALGFSRTTKEYVLCENTDYAAHPDTQRKPSVKMAYTDYLLTTVSAGIFLAWALLVKSPVEAFDVLMPSSDDGWIATTIGAFFICLPAGVFGMSAYYLWKTAYLSQKTQAYVCIAVMGIASLTWSLLMFMVYSPWLIWFAVGDSYLLHTSLSSTPVEKTIGELKQKNARRLPSGRPDTAGRLSIPMPATTAVAAAVAADTPLPSRKIVHRGAPATSSRAMRKFTRKTKSYGRPTMSVTSTRTDTAIFTTVSILTNIWNLVSTNGTAPDVPASGEAATSGKSHLFISGSTRMDPR